MAAKHHPISTDAKTRLPTACGESVGKAYWILAVLQSISLCWEGWLQKGVL